ncbi:MAG: hypothetical protein ACRDHP_09875, partial [Ktedonobacterales bacterium]
MKRSRSILAATLGTGAVAVAAVALVMSVFAGTVAARPKSSASAASQASQAVHSMGVFQKGAAQNKRSSTNNLNYHGG